MIKKLIVAAALTAATTGYAVAGPTDFYATPMNSGAPTNLPGETIIPGMTQAMQIVNGVTQPILQPILAPGGGAKPMMADNAPMMKRHHGRHHHMMMHKKMMRSSGRMPGSRHY